MYDPAMSVPSRISVSMLFFSLWAWSQTASTISTFAGRDWIFPADGKLGLQAPIGQIDGLAYDRDSNLYMADMTNHMVFQLRPDGSLKVFAGNGIRGSSGDGGPARNASLTSPRGLAFDVAGNLYIADYGECRIRRVTPGGVISTVAGGVCGFSGDGGPANLARLQGVIGLAFNSTGILYVADYGNARIRAITPDGRIRTVAGNGRAGFSGDNGPALEASISPRYLLVAPDDSLIISEWNNNRLRKLSANGTIATIAGTGNSEWPVENRPAVQSSLRTPAGLAMDREGNLFVAEAYDILRIDTNGIVHIFAGNRTVGQSSTGPALTTPIGTPQPLALSPAGELVYSDTRYETVGAVSDGYVSRLAGDRGSWGFVPDGTPASLAYLLGPQGLAFDRSGNLFVSDYGRNVIGKIAPDGSYSRFAGSGPGGIGLIGASARDARFWGARSIAADASGQVYFSSSVGFIWKIDAAGKLRLVAGTGELGFQGDGGTATQARIGFPGDLAFDSEGGLIFADPDNRRIRRIDTNGIIRTIAGDGQDRYFGDGGPAVQASFRQPLGVAVMRDGSIVVTDFVDNRIRMISPNGTISTIAGNGQAGFSGDGGAASLARLSGPGSVAITPEDQIIFIDRNNRRIRRIDGRVITTVAGNGVRANSGDGGLASQASFMSLLFGLAVDASGRVFVSDQDAGRVRVIQQVGTSLSFVSQPIIINVSQGMDATPWPLTITANRPGVPVTISSDVPWLGVEQPVLTTPALVNVLASARMLVPGTYRGLLIANSPVATPTSIQVTLNVTAPSPALLNVNPTEITRTLESPLSDQAIIKVTNAGGTPARLSAGIRFDNIGNWMNFSSALASNSLGAGESVQVPVTFQTRALSPGTYSGAVVFTLEGQPEQAVRITLQVTQQLRPRILLSQIGYTFTAVALGGTPAPQNLGVLNEGSGSLTFDARTVTLSGGAWLRVSPDGGDVARALQDVTFLDVAVEPQGLEPGEYYGRVEVTAGAADNTPQIATVLLKVLPPGSAQVPEVRPAGLVFISEQGADPGSQIVRIANVAGNDVSFVSGPLTSDRGQWLQYSPDVGAPSADEPANIVVQPEHRQLAPGVRSGTINLLFTNTGEARAVKVLSIVAPRGSANIEGKPGQRFLTGCPGATLRIQHLTLDNSFVAVAGEPTDIRIRVIDDCGTPLTPNTAPKPQVSITADTGDDVRLVHVGNGEWRGTWRPRTAKNLATVAVSIIAGDLRTPVEIVLRTGRVFDSGLIPVVRSGALRHSATLQTEVPVAPGHLISILGNGLSNKEEAANTPPLPRRLNDTEVILGGRPLSLLYTSSGQINAQIPYDIPSNTEQQLYVIRDRTLSVPEKFVIAAAQPGIFTVNQQGFGQGIIVLPDGVTVADTKSPAPRGSEVILYASGLGAVTPAVEAGEAAPNPPPRVVAPVQVTIGGRDAPLLAATLSPGVAGRYEVRVRVPADSPTGNEIPVILKCTDRTSQVVTMAIR